MTGYASTFPGQPANMSDSKDHVNPPPMANSLHRKLMGTFLLNTRLGARVNVQELIRPYLRVWKMPHDTPGRSEFAYRL